MFPSHHRGHLSESRRILGQSPFDAALTLLPPLPKTAQPKPGGKHPLRCCQSQGYWHVLQTPARPRNNPGALDSSTSNATPGKPNTSPWARRQQPRQAMNFTSPLAGSSVRVHGFTRPTNLAISIWISNRWPATQVFGRGFTVTRSHTVWCEPILRRKQPCTPVATTAATLVVTWVVHRSHQQVESTTVLTPASHPMSHHQHTTLLLIVRLLPASQNRNRAPNRWSHLTSPLGGTGSCTSSHPAVTPVVAPRQRFKPVRGPGALPPQS